jgi:hypothetical protein
MESCLLQKDYLARNIHTAAIRRGRSSEEALMALWHWGLGSILLTFSHLGRIPAIVALGDVVNPQRAIDNLEAEHLPKAFPITQRHLCNGALHADGNGVWPHCL